MKNENAYFKYLHFSDKKWLLFFYLEFSAQDRQKDRIFLPVACTLLSLLCFHKFKGNVMLMTLKGTVHCRNENLYFLTPAQTNWMQPILLSYQANSSIPVGDLAYTGEGTLSKIWTGLRSKSGILKTCGILELCLDMGSRIKKNQFGCRSVPLNIVCFSKMLWFFLTLPVLL